MSDRGDYWSRTVSLRYGRRRMLMAGGAGALAVAAVACGSQKRSSAGASTQSRRAGSSPALTNEPPKTGGKLVYPTNQEPPDLDPRTVLSVGLYGFATSVMNRVVRTVEASEAKSDIDFTLKPDLAASWEQPEDLTSVTFRLNQGVKWQDIPPVSGRELTSADIKYTFESYRDSGAHVSYFDTLDRVETPDPYTAKFVLKEPFSGMLETLTVPVQLVFAHEVVEKYGDLKSAIIGTGPFMMSKFERKVGFSAVKNPNYFKKGLPYLDGFEQPFVTDGATRKASIRSGQADIVVFDTPADADELQRSNPSLMVQEAILRHSGRGIMMNQTRPPYNDLRVRRAISMAVDRAAILKNVLQGHGALGWGIPWIWWLDAEPTIDQLGPWWKYNPAEAKKLMAAAGYQDGFKDTFKYWEYEPAVTSEVQVAQAQLKKNLNLDLEIQLMDYPSYFKEYTSHKWNGIFWGFQIGSSSTVDDFTYQNVLSTSEANYMYMKDDQIDALARQIRKEGDLTKRKALIKQMVDREHDQAYRLWMPYRNQFFIMQPHVRGFQALYLRGGGADYGGAARELHWNAKA